MEKASRGFSLVELMVVVALLAVVLGFAVPNMRQMILNNRIKAATNSLVGALQMARNEAITRNKSVFFCPTAGGDSCSGSDYTTLAVVDGKDNKVIQRIEKPSGTVQIKAKLSGNKLTFNRSGVVADAKNSVSFYVYDERSNLSGEDESKWQHNASARLVCIRYFGQVSVLEGNKTCTN